MKTNSQIKRYFAILPIIAFGLIFIVSCGKNIKTDNSNPAIEEKTTDGAYKVVDVMPVFPGGDTALLSFIAKNTVYPEQAKLNAIQGKVLARFMVKEDGTVSDVTILQSANPELDAESIRVVSSLPKFTPGLLKGKAVPVWYMIPIDFKLK
jgi:TonB family protein